MTSYFTEDFERGTDGAALSSSNTNFDTYGHTGLVFSATPTPLDGSLRMKVAVGSTAQYLYAQGPLAGGAQSGALYFCYNLRTPPTMPPAANTYLSSFWAAATTNVAEVRIGTGGKISFRVNQVLQWTGSAVLEADHDYYVQHYINKTAGEARLQVWDATAGFGSGNFGSMPFGSGEATLIDDSGVIAASLPAAPDNIRVGSLTAVANTTLYFDDVQVADSSIGPPAAGTVASVWYRFDGATWVPVTLMRV